MGKLPKDFKFALEIRNKAWLDLQFVDLLRKHRVALALIDQSWVPRPWEMKEKIDLATTDWTYVRGLATAKELKSKQKPGTKSSLTEKTIWKIGLMF
jgi:uncharacterized protein YecE (DUF72 family)